MSRYEPGMVVRYYSGVREKHVVALVIDDDGPSGGYIVAPLSEDTYHVMGGDIKEAWEPDEAGDEL